MCGPSADGDLLERAGDVFGAILEFSAIGARVSHDELRSASARLTGEALAHCEGHAQRCVHLLLAALSNAGPQLGAAHDAVWILNRMARRSAAARSWIVDAKGVEVVHAAVLAHYEDPKLLHDGTWLCYTADGLRGLAALLCLSRGGTSAGHAAIRAAVAWNVFELVKGEREDCGMETRPESGSVLAILVEALGHESSTQEGQWACCAALDAMVKEEPRLGALFMERGGASLLVRALRAAGAMGADGEDFRRAVSYLVSSLTDGNAQAVHALRAEGALEALRTCALRASGMDVAAAMWALGSLGGTAAVLDAMAAAGGRARPDVLRGGVAALSECAWQATGDREELARQPEALRVLLECCGCEALTEDRCFCARALGCVLAGLTPHAAPGQVATVDCGVETLLKYLHMPGNGCAAPLTTQEVSSHLAGAIEAASESLGRIALVAPRWREALRACGAPEVIARWVRLVGPASGPAAAAAGSGLQPGWLRKLQKYLFWAAAAISGLPFVATEMRQCKGSVEVVDAGLCTVIDILDDDLDGDYALVGVDKCSDGDMPILLGLVLELMQLHSNAPEVQARACKCVELLAPILALSDSKGAVAAVAPCLAAARRFSRRSDVAAGALGALRSLCVVGLRTASADGGASGAAGAGAGAGAGGSSAVAAALRDEDAADFAELALDTFADGSGGNDLLEDACAVLAMAGSAEAVLRRLDESTLGMPVREAGLKALFEVGRLDLRFLAGSAEAAASTCRHLAAEASAPEASSSPSPTALLLGGGGSPATAAKALKADDAANTAAAADASAARVREAAALLYGLCGRAPVPFGGA
eukprot:TRINITY_DN9854_c0_g1_i1.p1 TRINITY_DN9854_c0_g1~~TRINITY_DN9854_c0_g1_i1.p1  ORF type:complete len:824 (+),score=210.31 TRINITY_DN9854_c0_g1_i1:85-2556(+)